VSARKESPAGAGRVQSGKFSERSLARPAGAVTPTWGQGVGLHMIGKMLGHTQAQTTAPYAHLATDPVKEATEKVGERIAALLGDVESKTSLQ
jgi:hypothetical protein